MKIIKYTLRLCLIALTIISCTEDDNTDYVKSIAAPTNVSAAVRVTQDNTGLVTITPLGEGVVSFTVNFGDGSEISQPINSGKSLEHVYAEGTYEAIIVATGLNGLTTTAVQNIVVSFKAPENLVVIIENDPAISKQVNVTATADFALSYEVYFGEPGNDEPIVGNNGDTVSYQYQQAGTYTIRVVSMSAAVETTEYSEAFLVTAILQPLAPAPTPTKAQSDVVSIYSDSYTDPDPIDYYPNWGQTTTYTQIAVNGNNMIQYGGLTYQGIDFNTVPVDASAMEYLHVDIWTADAFDAKISPISPGPNEAAYDLILTADQWNSFDIPISYFTDLNASLDFSSIFQFKFDGVPSGAGTIFVDNLYFYKAPSTTGSPLIFDDFEGNGNITTWFGDAAGMDNAFANPYQEGINTSSTVLQYNDTGGQYANVRFDVVPNFDMANNSTFSLKIYVPSSSISGTQPNQISLKLQDGTVAEPWAQQTEIIKPIVLDQWQEIFFDFANDAIVGASNPLSRTDFNRVVLQVNSENNTDTVIAYFDDIAYGEATIGDSAPYVTDDFEGNGTITTWFGDAAGMDSAFVNPYQEGINTSSTVLQYNDTGGQYANVRFDVTPNFDLMAKSKFTLKIYVPSSSISGTQPNQISLKLQDGTVAEPWAQQTEIIKPVVLDQWQEITFDFANDTTVGASGPLNRTDFNRVVLQVNSENNTDTVIAYIDDFNYYN
tara:strand:+ start:16502 stop:18649 length:2148 start_codon:yes stop_codon:yes gene_type:complete